LADGSVCAIDDIDDTSKNNTNVGNFDAVFKDNFAGNEIATEREIDQVLELGGSEKVEVRDSSQKLGEICRAFVASCRSVFALLRRRDGAAFTRRVSC
jgi:hypothetical protein